MIEFDNIHSASPYVRHIGTTLRNAEKEAYTVSMEIDNVLIYVQAGECVHTVNGRKRLLTQGMIEIIPPYSSQTVSLTGGQVVQLVYLYFDLFETPESHSITGQNRHTLRRQIPERELYFMDRDTLAVTSEEDRPKITALLVKMKASDDNMERKIDLLTLLHIFQKSTKVPEGRQSRGKRNLVAKAMRLIEKEYGDYELCCKTLACRLQFSPGYLSHLFQQEIGMPPVTYIRNVRISRAKEFFHILPSITEVSKKCGFSSIQSFSRAFRNTEGISPSAFIHKLSASEETEQAEK